MIRKMLAVLILTGAAFAQMQMAPRGGPTAGRRAGSPARRGMMGPGPRLGLPGGKFWTNTDLAQKIGLTPAQVQQMEKLFQDSRLELIDKVANVQKAEVTLEPMLQADRPDENAVLAQIDKIAQARADLEKTNARMMLGIRQVMSVDQWNKLKEEIPRRRAAGPGRPGLFAGPTPNRGQGRPQGPPPAAQGQPQPQQ